MKVKKNKKLRLRRFYQASLGRTLLIYFLLLSLIPMTVVSIISYKKAMLSLEEYAEEKLRGISQLKAASINNWFLNQFLNLKAQAESHENADFLEDLENAFKASGKDVSEFVRSYKWRKIVEGQDSNEQQGAALKNFKKIYGYYDILLIDKKGNILFNVDEEEELGTNLFNGKYANTLLAKSCKKALKSGRPQFSDLEFFGVLGIVSGFLTSVIVDEDGEKIGLIAFQISNKNIDEIIFDRTGLGKTGQTYLVGWAESDGFLMRSNSSLIEDSVVLKRQVNNIQTQNWHNEHVKNEDINHDETAHNEDEHEDELEEQIMHYIGLDNNKVLGIHHTICIAGVHWVIIAEIDESEAFLGAKSLRNIVIFLVLITGLLVFLIASIITRRIVKPIILLSNATKKLAKGELDYLLPIKLKNEIGDLAQSFTYVVDNLKKVATQSNAIAIGDLSSDIKLLSDKDELGIALQTMIKTLRETTSAVEKVAKGNLEVQVMQKSENDILAISINKMAKALKSSGQKDEKQGWLNTGQTKLADLMRGSNDINTLAKDIIVYLAKYLDAQVGTFYVADAVSDDDESNEKEQCLYLSGSYAFTKRKNLVLRIKPGEGLVGQAFLEKQPIILSDIPKDYIRIDSSLGYTSPRYIIAMPVTMGDTIKGVIELGSLTAFSDIKLEFLNRISESIAITLYAAQESIKTKELLEKTQTQSEELQNQQDQLKTYNKDLEEQTQLLKKNQRELKQQSEELQASNEELEEQTQLLKSSEEELKQQSEELQAANEELEEKTLVLNKQNDEIQKKSVLIENRAKDLALASKYKSEFLANMSHELRTPLNSLLLLANNLVKNADNNLNPMQIEDCQIIYDGGKDLLNLINDILDLSKVEAGKLGMDFQKVNLDSILETLKNQMEPLSKEKGLEFVIEKLENIPNTLITDGKRLEQIIKNILSNAFKFTEKGSVTLKIFKPGKRSDDLFSENSIAFSVTDTGIGIAGDKQKAIFEAFQQAEGSTTRVYGGTGLGLTISRELAAKLGGKIILNSETGKGSTFTLYLPIKDANEITQEDLSPKSLNSFDVNSFESSNQSIVSSKPDESTKEENRQEKINFVDKIDLSDIPKYILDDRYKLKKDDKVLIIIEDDAKFAKHFIKIAHKKGFKCIAAQNGIAGLKLVSYFQPTGVILDIGLPDINGAKVLDYLKQEMTTRHIPIHIISAADKDPLLLQKGAIGQLTKPVEEKDIDEVFSKLENVLADKIKKILVVEDDEKHNKAIVRLISRKSIDITTAATAKEAQQAIKQTVFDCIILDLKLPDMSGLELLKKLKLQGNFNTPVIVYTGKDLSPEEHNQLKMYAKSIIVKEAESSERLLDDISLFLHSVESQLPEKQKKVIQMLHDSSAMLKDKTLLLVDDDMRNNYALNRALKGYGLKTIIAANGKKALELLDQHDNIDLVLMDIMMPEMDGFEAMQKIRAQKKFENLPIIALTAKAMSEDRNKCIEAGANDYLTKPVDEERLISMIKVWLFESKKK